MKLDLGSRSEKKNEHPIKKNEKRNGKIVVDLA
jgi:hypothetical protein